MAITDVVDTGLGASWSSSVNALTAKILSIKANDETLEKLEYSYLGQSGAFKLFTKSDLVEPGEVEIEILHPTSVDLPAITNTVTETGTITFPIRKVASTTTTSNETQGATIVGSGFYVGKVRPTLQLGQLQVSRLRFAFDGVTGPTETKSA